MQNEPEKASLFLRLGVLFVMWFLALPLIVLVALGIAPWDREKVVSGLLITVSLLAYSTLVTNRLLCAVARHRRSLL
jgi:hypothetical protein